MLLDTYLTIEAKSLGEFKDKGSKFLAYAAPVYTLEECKSFLAEIKLEHPKARHHCYAYRLGIDKTKDFRANDDGEPSGTAGRPIIGQIDSKGLSNCMAIVVRYFGGTKLGVPGLINAYKTSTKLALESASIIEKLIQSHYRISFGYVQMNDIMKLVKRHDIKISNTNFDNNCSIDITLRLSEAEKYILLFEKVDGSEIELLYTA